MAKWKLEPGMIEKQFKPWQSGNPSGRPKKWISMVNEELKAKWYDPARKQDIEENYLQMLQLEESELKAMLNDKEKPMLVRILARNMLGGKWFEIIETMLDRAVGKAVQKNENENTNKWKIDIIVKLPKYEE